ncbi:rhamnosyltransferase [Terribacillus aidingensis]|uniref:Rhamnosyltransferase n=1 Tax=Terribacillus aidingensis TaxID=586416 RepID=A0A285N633_9BACI|nr:DUF1972 domain-containing protein [Terribacillus aidingensis]SNZ04768.1 rhamnosyltransferase [Terribacillus aidingensis]
MKHIFIIGSKGIPAKYGGFETFVDELVSRKQSSDISYHVSCLADNSDEFTYKGTRCFNVTVKDIGNAKAITYDIASLNRCIEYIKKNNIKDAIIYILASRIGPFLQWKRRTLSKLGVRVFLNPDGIEWKRSKWSYPVRKYWKFSERYMVKSADLVICDSKNIEKYIRDEYTNFNPKTIFIPYGAEILENELDSSDWFEKHKVKKNMYYLMVGRFVPENNYELVIREFMNSNSTKDLVIITNHLGTDLFEKLSNKLRMGNDKRIKFVGTVYDSQLLNKIRQDSFAYIHGHSVGGTNPSLLEALSITKLNLLYDVSFNREVGEEAGIYFTSTEGSLRNRISEVEELSEEQQDIFGRKAKQRISDDYSWGNIVADYENEFLKEDL